MTTSFSERDWFERIVEEVIRRLLARGVGVQTAPPRADLVLDEKVVSLSTLDGRIGAVQRVVVSPGAVVTPAVKDELRERGVELIRAGQASGTGNRKAT